MNTLLAAAAVLSSCVNLSGTFEPPKDSSMLYGLAHYWTTEAPVRIRIEQKGCKSIRLSSAQELTQGQVDRTDWLDAPIGHPLPVKRPCSAYPDDVCQVVHE